MKARTALLLATSWIGVKGAMSVPTSVVVETRRGETRVPVRSDLPGPVVPAAMLLPALGGVPRINDPWLSVDLAGATFDFLIGAPFYRVGEDVRPMVGSVLARGDTMFLP